MSDELKHTLIKVPDAPKTDGPKFIVALPSDEELQQEIEDNPARSILRQTLKPIYDHLLHPEVEEIAINRPDEIWIKLRKAVNGNLWLVKHDDRLSRSYLSRICHMMANGNNTPNFGPEGIPVVYGTIPGGHRFGAGLGPNIQYNDAKNEDQNGSICICIRQYIEGATITLADYGVQKGKPIKNRIKSIYTKNNDPNDPYVKIFNSLDRGDHILLSGATDTGKTSALNHIIKQMDLDKRVLTLEDTRELKVPHPNRVHIVMSRTTQSNQFTYMHVRDLAVRMTPDIIMAGEISNQNAATIWELMTTGHGHFMTTIHAESADEAITTFIGCIMNARAAAGVNSMLDMDDLRRRMAEKLRIIQIKRDDDNGRYISEVR